MKVVTKAVQKYRKWRCRTQRFAKETKWYKQHAKRAYRHAAKIAIRVGGDINEKPRYTEYDVI
jgi:hypothetical protein